MKWLLLLLIVVGCQGPAQPSLYSDVTALEFDGQTGGAVRVGVNLPLGVGFREPPARSPGAVARRQLAATLALVESLEKRDVAPAADAQPTPGPTSAAAPEALHLDGPQAESPDDEDDADDEHLSLEHAADVRAEVDAWGWDAIGKFAILGLILGALYATWRVLNARWPKR